MQINNNTKDDMQTQKFPHDAETVTLRPGISSSCNRSEVKLLLQFAAQRGKGVAKRLCRWYSMRLSLHRPLSDMGMEVTLARLWELAMQQSANDALASWEPPENAGNEEAIEQITYPEVDSNMVDVAMCAIVEQSIARQWVAFYPLEPKPKEKSTHGNRPLRQHRITTADDTDEQRIQLIASLTR